MTGITGVILAIALSQSAPTIAIILDGRSVIVARADAEAQLKTTRDPKLKAALEIALGIQTTQRLSYSDFHRERWQRQPLNCNPVPQEGVVCR